MQRRLAIAFVLTALFSVLLVGFGVLAIAQAGARNRAEDEVVRSLSVVGSLLGSNGRQLRQLEELVPANRRDLQLDQLTPVVISDDGSVRAISRRGRAQPSTGPELADRRLSPDELTRLDDGETIVTSEANTVIGLRAIETPELPADARLALLARQRLTAVPRQTVAWFLLSSLIVIVGALVAGVLLARRLVRPIQEIQGATAAIAAGQLTARVAADGDDELAELGRSVNRMAADLERSKALDQQFLLSVSHDLRTPLTAISGYAEALRDGAVADPSGAGEVIGNHADRLDRLVGDLLDLAKLDANRFRLELRPVDVGVVTGRTVAGLAAEAATHGVTLEHRLDASPIVRADADRMAQVVGNLVDNAVSFAHRRVRIIVSVEPASGGGQLAIVTVTDDGPGFAAEDLPFVFDRLYTGRARPRRAENPTGLGLAIVRDLAGAMGGAVTAANGSDGGAALVLSFPVADRAEQQGPAAGVDPVTTGEQPPRPTPEAHPRQPPGALEPRPPA